MGHPPMPQANWERTTEMESKVSTSKLVTTMSSLLAVPLLLLVIRLTEGTIFPHLPGQGETWNIQYMLPGSLALLVVILLIVFRSHRNLGRGWYWIAMIWNLLFVAVCTYATIILWGEKY